MKRGRRPLPHDRVTVPMIADAMALAVMQMYVAEGGRDFREVLPKVLEAFDEYGLFSDDYGSYEIRITKSLISRVEYLWNKRGLSRRIKRGRGPLED